jgi:hypothetical protein
MAKPSAKPSPETLIGNNQPKGKAYGQVSDNRNGGKSGK